MLKIGAKGVRIGNVDIPAQELGEVKIERVLMGTGSAATEHYTLHVADQAVATNLGHEALTWIVEAIESIRIEPAADYWNERSAARAALRDLTERT